MWEDNEVDLGVGTQDVYTLNNLFAAIAAGR